MQDQGRHADVRDELAAAAGFVIVIHTVESMQCRSHLVVKQAERTQFVQVDVQGRRHVCKFTSVGVSQAVYQVTLVEPGDTAFEALGSGVEQEGY